MVLMAAEGLRNDEIAARLRCGRDVVSQWRKRFFEQRLAGLEDRPRRGRPPAFPPSGRAEVIASGVRAAGRERRAARRAGHAASSPARRSRAGSSSRSRVTVWRWLSEDAISPWNYRSWIFPRDPQFAAQGRPDPRPLRTAAGKANCCTPATTSSAAMRSPRSKPASASTRRCPPAAGGAASASSTSTSATARSATSPPGTSDAPGCSTAARPRTGSYRSTRSSSSS